MNRRTYFSRVMNQIWFPKETKSSYFFQYGITTALGIVLLILRVFFQTAELHSLFLLFFIISITLATFIGSMKTGSVMLLISCIIIISSSYELLQTNNFKVIEFFAFLVTSITTIRIIGLSKKTPLLSIYNKKEKEYQGQITKIQKEKAEAEKEIRLRDEFMSIASHELKTPLTTTLLKLQTALHNVRNVSLANFSVQNLLDMLESAETQTKRLAKMINDLLNISLMRTGRLELEMEVLDLHMVTQEVTRRFTEKAESENTHISLQLQENVQCLLDRVRIEQVLTNLISNAMKYGKGKPITISLEKQGGKACIKIKDNGIGIAKDQQERIFQLFERGVKRNDIKGLGIGLYISNQIVLAHGGKIIIHSKENKGSEFIVEIPMK